MRALDRVAGLRAAIEAGAVSAFACSSAVNVAYLTGFEGVFDGEDAHIALVSEGECRLYTDTRYIEAARSAARGGPWQVRLAAADVWESVLGDLEPEPGATLGVEDAVSVRSFSRIERLFDGEVKPLEGWVERLRQVKSAEEVARVAAAAELTDAAFEHVVERIAVGVEEREIALDLEVWMRRHGSDGVAFDPIVASGPNSALPHARPTDRRIEAGDFVKLDFGARVDGYCADMTRTVVVGSASAQQREIYDAVLAANRTGVSAVRAGVPGAQVDAAARDVITERGFGERFGHGLGHGVGLEVHELPRLGPRATEPVPAGSVVTIEPGVYVPGFGGVRIEDLVAVEEDGCRVLSNSPRELIEL